MFYAYLYTIMYQLENMFFTAAKASYDIQDIYNKMKPEERTNLLFSHSFSGCDTVSGIYGFGKVSILHKLLRKKVLKQQ